TGGLFREHVLPGTVEISSVSSGYCMRASTDLPLVVGGRYRLRRIDQPADRGREMPLEFVLCLPLELERQAKKSLGESLTNLAREVSQARVHAVALRLLGWVSVPTRVTSKAILEAAATLKSPHGADDMSKVIEIEGPALTRYLIVPELLSKIRAGIGRTVKQGAGETAVKIAAHLDLAADLVEAVVGGMEDAGEVAREEGVVLPAGSKAGLSPMEHGIVDQLNRDAEEGNLGRGGKGADREILKKLVRLRVLVELGDRYCSMESYSAFARSLLNGKKPGGIVTIAEAKESLGLPREQTIQFLESLNDRGVLRRDGDVHRVVRGLEVR
ncbi:MAG TPA: SelB C-terminal domain-containing protein, partial [Spirochaetia bacterium]|nr:SelB C-terminal domain-containing protein [Spirochaetia bacterium]